VHPIGFHQGLDVHGCNLSQVIAWRSGTRSSPKIA
jgi:hypothetical protein